MTTIFLYFHSLLIHHCHNKNTTNQHLFYFRRLYVNQLVLHHRFMTTSLKKTTKGCLKQPLASLYFTVRQRLVNIDDIARKLMTIFCN